MTIPVRLLNFIGCRIQNVGAIFTECALQFDTIHQYPKDEYARYKREDPTEQHRVDYPLTPTSVVVDVGGFTGDWAQRIYCRYSCYIDIYEAHPYFASVAALNFENNPKVIVHDLALGNHDGLLLLFGDNMNASHTFNETAGRGVYAPLVRKASDVFKDLYPDGIDLLKINVEGAEYDILLDLIANYDMKNIGNLQIQFHKVGEEYEQKRNRILCALAKTHKCTWRYDWIFENWEVLK